MKLYRIGFILTVLGWIACLNPYWIIFAWPVFTIGLIMVWLSKTRIKIKLLTTILPLIFWYPGVYAFIFFGNKHMTPETFLIPKTFRGQITLIYNEPCGQTLYKVDGRLIYKIPDNGVMILTNELETGLIDQEYYFVDHNWNKIEKIPTLMQQDFNANYTLEKNKNEPPRNKIGVFNLGTGVASTTKNRDFNFHTMDINSWDSLKEEEWNINDNLIDSLLFLCRQKK